MGFTYRIANSDVENLVKPLFVSELAFKSVLVWTCDHFIDSETDFITLNADKFQSATGCPINVGVKKSDIELFYTFESDEWNEYPKVTPPKDKSYYVTVLLEDGKTVTDVMAYYRGTWYDEFANPSKNEVIAFYELPKPFEK